MMQVAIVGAGPAGFYVANRLLKTGKDISVTFFEKNFHPFGLIRTGVSPDSLPIKVFEFL